MALFRHLFRLFRINAILMRYSIAEIIFSKPILLPLRIIAWLNPYYWTRNRKLTRGERIRRALEELGPIFVKAGQIVSTRRDLLPSDIASELSQLQDRVTPFKGTIAKKIIEKSLERPLGELFATFEINALASASIAQVHAATLISGEDVVVKVLRPKIKESIDRDISLLRSFAKLALRFAPDTRQFKPKEMVEEVAQTLYGELDLLREGANASQLKRNFADSPDLYIPKIYWDYSRHDVLVIERIHGIPIHDFERLRSAGVNTELLAQKGIEIFFTQVFRDSFFHADLHPGNIFVCDEDPEDPSFIAVDFGIAGSLSHEDQRYLAENMIAFFKRDYQRIAELHIACGWLPPDARIDQFEGAIRAVSEPIFERPLKDISFGKLMLHLFQVAKEFDINIQPQLILLQKTLFSVEGLCRQLAPDFDLWTSASPQIERWLKRQVGAHGLFKRLRENVPLWSEYLPEMPGLIYEVLKETKNAKEAERFAHAKQLTHEKNNNGKHWRYFFYGVLTTLGVSATTLLLILAK